MKNNTNSFLFKEETFNSILTSKESLTDKEEWSRIIALESMFESICHVGRNSEGDISDNCNNRWL